MFRCCRGSLSQIMAPAISPWPTGGDASSTFGRRPGALGANARTLVWVNRHRCKEESLRRRRTLTNIRAVLARRWESRSHFFDQAKAIWIWDLGRATLTRLTLDPGSNHFPLWTPDSRRVLFTSPRGGSNTNLFWQAADNTGTAELVRPRVPTGRGRCLSLRMGSRSCLSEM